MKKIEIYKEEALVVLLLVDTYEINTYINSFEVTCKLNGIEISYSIPLNKGYKLVVEI